MNAPTLGQRLSFDGHLCTVRYVGTVQGTTGDWLGVEWDDTTRGKHSGEHKGIRYFSCMWMLLFIIKLLLTLLQAKATNPQRGLLFVPPDHQTNPGASLKPYGKSMLLSLWRTWHQMLQQPEHLSEERQLKSAARSLRKLASTRFGSSSQNSKSYASCYLMDLESSVSHHPMNKIMIRTVMLHEILGELVPRSQNSISVEVY
jgi:hypothetical protein